MVLNSRIKIVSVLVILINVLPIILVNYIPRGNFFADIVLSVIYVIILLIQSILTFFIFISENKRVKMVLLIFSLVGLIVCYYFLYGYIYELS